METNGVTFKTGWVKEMWKLNGYEKNTIKGVWEKRKGNL